MPIKKCFWWGKKFGTNSHSKKCFQHEFVSHIYFTNKFTGGSDFTGHIDILNLDTNHWSLSFLSQTRDYTTSLSLLDYVFIAGGRSNLSSSSVVDIFQLCSSNSCSKNYICKENICQKQEFTEKKVTSNVNLIVGLVVGIGVVAIVIVVVVLWRKKRGNSQVPKIDHMSLNLTYSTTSSSSNSRSKIQEIQDIVQLEV